MRNAQNIVLSDMERHIVEVKLPGKRTLVSLALIEIVVKANMVDVLAQTYGAKFAKFHRKVAQKLYGKKESELTFGALFSGNEMVYAFSRDLADYDQETSTIKYRDLEDVLVETVKPSSSSSTEPSSPSKPPRPSFPYGGGAVVRYAITEKSAKA